MNVLGNQRGTGRTHRMLEELVEAVEQGQPMSLVIGASFSYSLDLLNRLCRMLKKKGLKPKHTKQYAIEVDGCIVEAVSVTNITFKKGILDPSCGIFVVHYAPVHLLGRELTEFIRILDNHISNMQRRNANTYCSY